MWQSLASDSRVRCWESGIADTTGRRVGPRYSNIAGNRVERVSPPVVVAVVLRRLHERCEGSERISVTIYLHLLLAMVRTTDATT